MTEKTQTAKHHSPERNCRGFSVRRPENACNATTLPLDDARDERRTPVQLLEAPTRPLEVAAFLCATPPTAGRAACRDAMEKVDAMAIAGLANPRQRWRSCECLTQFEGGRRAAKRGRNGPHKQQEKGSEKWLREWEWERIGLPWPWEMGRVPP